MDRWFYGVKSFTMKASGFVKIDEKKLEFGKVTNVAGDWGRATFNYSTFWLWSFA